MFFVSVIIMLITLFLMIMVLVLFRDYHEKPEVLKS